MPSKHPQRPRQIEQQRPVAAGSEVGHILDVLAVQDRDGLGRLERDPGGCPQITDAGSESPKLGEVPPGRGHQQRVMVDHDQVMTTESSPSSGSGHCIASPSRVWTMISLTSRLRNHLRSAGITYQGACAVLVRSSIAVNAAW